MWNPTASSSDNKQNIDSVFDVEDCKCSGTTEQLDQKQISSNKQQTSRICSPLTSSTNIKNQDEDFTGQGEDNTKNIDYAGETSDSGFISGPQNLTPSYMDIESEAADDFKELNTTKSAIDYQIPYKTVQQELDLDSGLIEEEYPHNESDLEEPNKSNMILPHNVDSGISEWFCNLSLQNNVAGSNINTFSNNLATRQEEHSKTTFAAGAQQCQQQQQQQDIPRQITSVNAWEKCYQQDDDGDTYLHLACISGSEDAVAALIRMAIHPCLLNILNDHVQTPLHLATITGQPKIIRMLLIAGAEPTIRDRHGNTALHLACKSGEEQCVRALTIPISASEVNEAHRQYGYRVNDKSYLNYAKLPSDLEIRNYDGERCVHLAAQAGFINILRILVLYGADLNAREGKSGRTPLHIAIDNCNEELANYLLDDCQKLNIEAVTYAGLTAYQVACRQNKSEMQYILEKKGAEPLSPPDSEYDSSDSESELDDLKLYDRFGDPGYFVRYKGGNVMTVA